MAEPIRILIVEDLPTDAELAEREIRQALKLCVFWRVETRPDYLAALEEFQPDLIVSDYQMPHFDGLTALKLALERAPLTPLIILTGAINEDTAVECMKAGAVDYVIKEHIKRLGQAVIHALEEKQVRHERLCAAEALRESEERFRSLYENATIGLYRTTPDGQILLANPAAVQMLGFDSFDDLAQRNLEQEGFDLFPRSVFCRRIERDGVVTGLESAWLRKDGSTIFVRESARAIRDETGQVLYYDGTFEDITERKQMEQALHLTQFCVDQASIAIFLSGPDGRIRSVNEEARRSLGYTREELCNMNITDIDPSFSRERWQRHRQDLQAHGSTTFETIHQHKDGTTFPVEITVTYLEFQGEGFGFSFVRDISERKQAEEAQAKLEEQLRQAQKMESIGRLAGGVAHDFNNLLTVIQGYCDFMDAQIPAQDPMRKELEQIQRAGDRAAALTRQLLAFSRRQVLAPTVLDLNSLVTNLRKMLERLIGEDIVLTFILEPGLWSMTADLGQIEQVIMNLVVNARDAMPTGGTLTIQTGNVLFDENYAQTSPDALVGPYVMLMIADSGQGMDEQTQAQIFEPFFTTKDAERGTGLGLATVYGTVKQSGGNITVFSKPEQGTVFKIFLPANETSPNDLGLVGTHPLTQPVIRGGTETILLAEDEQIVRDLVQTALENMGYTVLQACQGDEALSQARQHQGAIHLLVTDVVMPHMSGRELAERLTVLRPETKVLFISGYTDDAVVRHGLLPAKVEFLAKPLSPSKLVAKVREMLDK